MVLIIGVALVAALVVRHSSSVEAARRLTLIAIVALALRLAAVTAVYVIAIRTHIEGTFLNNEASFYLATESLMPNPFDKALPQGLDHLGGDGYLGLLTAVSVALGSSFAHMDTVAFRLVNATFGTLLALTVSLVAARMFGPRPALLAGLVIAVWPTLVLWSAMFLRDTLVGLTLVIVWWTLAPHRRLTDLRVICVAPLALLLMASLRPYVADALAVGIVCWGAWPIFAHRSRRFLVTSAAVGALLCVGLMVNQWRHIDEYAHQLVYRQLTTRMEAIGQLYSDPVPNQSPPESPFGPGAAVALVDPNSKWITPGLVQHPLGPGRVLVGFTDGSQHEYQISELTLLQSAPLSPPQLLSSLGPGLVAFISGTSVTNDESSLGWTADALAWDVLFLLAVLGGVRVRLPLREWILPASIVLGTAAALIVVPGAPGNDDRHRAPQALPFLVVFATAWLVGRGSESPAAGASVSRAISSPMTTGAAESSRMRSLR